MTNTIDLATSLAIGKSKDTAHSTHTQTHQSEHAMPGVIEVGAWYAIRHGSRQVAPF